MKRVIFLSATGVVSGSPTGGPFGSGPGSFGPALGPSFGTPLPGTSPQGIVQGPWTVTPGPATGAPIYPVVNLVCRPGKKDGLNVVCRNEVSDAPAPGAPVGLAWTNAPLPGW